MWFILIWITNNLWFKSGSGDIHGNSVSPWFCLTRVSIYFFCEVPQRGSSLHPLVPLCRRRDVSCLRLWRKILIYWLIHFFFFNPADYLGGLLWKYENFQEVVRGGLLLEKLTNTPFLKKHKKVKFFCPPRKLNTKYFMSRFKIESK